MLKSVPKNYAILIVVSVFFTLVCNFLVYNAEVVLEYLVKRDLPPFIFQDIARFFAYLLFCLVVTSKTSRGWWQFYILFIPIFLLDATTLIFGRQLIPFRFPYATVYPLLAIICAILVKKDKKLVVICLFVMSMIFLIVSEWYIKPAMVLKHHMANNVDNTVSSPFKNIDVITVHGKRISIADTIRGNPTVLEFYFVGCKPCDEKLNYLKILKDSCGVKHLNIMLVCDGNATSFDNFIKNAQEQGMSGLSFFYLKGNSQRTISIEGFPTQFTVAKGIICKKEVGFNITIAADWLRREIELIRKLAKD
ncbi:MAG: hypothetical protein EAZ47_08145 [Bacteroidetes bacterium]|nr:MAG: hypothetical protein EAY72_06245 [Bacteroidota bacterium]TAF92855.1 MAG: hypothetical protein EAZ47_08145 [Bacteroidota bacterium]